MTDENHYSYIEIEEKYSSAEQTKYFVDKVGWPHTTYSYQSRGPDDLRFYPLPDGNFVVIAEESHTGYYGDPDTTELTVYLATPETGDDHDARLARAVAEAEKSKKAAAVQRAANKAAKAKDLESAKKQLEKAGYKVSK